MPVKKKQERWWQRIEPEDCEDSPYRRFSDARLRRLCEKLEPADRKVLLNMLYERETELHKRQPQWEKQAAACKRKLRGLKRTGRPPKLTPAQHQDLCSLYRELYDEAHAETRHHRRPPTWLINRLPPQDVDEVLCSNRRPTQRVSAATQKVWNAYHHEAPVSVEYVRRALRRASVTKTP